MAVAIDTRKRQVTAAEFEDMIRANAYQIWLGKECNRRYRNWRIAAEQLSGEFLHGDRKAYTGATDIKALAYQFWLKRKDDDALEDWCEAVARVGMAVVVAA